MKLGGNYLSLKVMCSSVDGKEKKIMKRKFVLFVHLIWEVIDRVSYVHVTWDFLSELNGGSFKNEL